jgi:hypothetical protein
VLFVRFFNGDLALGHVWGEADQFIDFTLDEQSSVFSGGHIAEIDFGVNCHETSSLLHVLKKHPT